jgi:hypothetical protein
MIKQHEQLSNVFSPRAAEVLQAGGGARYAQLVVSSPPPLAAREMLREVKAAELVSSPVRDPVAAQALLAGLWLWHDFLDESHTASQAIATPTGSFWHAIMHRREGDFSNARYWYARCAGHRALAELGRQLASGTEPAPPGILRSNQWHPAALVDLVEEVHRTPDSPRHRQAVELQRLEWFVLFNSTAEEAVGR